MSRVGFFIAFLVLTSAGVAFWFFKGDSRLDTVESATQPSSVETPVRLDPVELATEQGLVEKGDELIQPAEMPVVESADFMKAAPALVTSVFDQQVVGTPVPNKSSLAGPGEGWDVAMQDLTEVNSNLADVEKMAGKTGLLPEADEIEERFAAFEEKLNALKSRQLPDYERDQIRESLQGLTQPMLARIHKTLSQREENHLVHLAQAELARAMESLQGF